MKPSDIFDRSTISAKRILTYALLFCLSFPLLSLLLGDDDPFWHNLIFSLSIGLLSIFFTRLSIRLFRDQSAWLQWVAVINGLLIATPLGARLGFWLTGADRDMPNDLLYYSIFASLPLGTFFSTIIMWVFYSRAKAAKIETDRLQLELSNETKEKQLSQAQLNLLQAQIEPHFLFNTLATVHSLIEKTPQQASRLLERINDYLRAALNHSRSKSCLLSDELDLLQAYLDIMKMRMGGRLDFDIIVDESAAKLPFPPMLLQPLVENAIKHGLEPKIEGGSLQISGMVKNEKLCLDVIDTGIGFENFKSEGVGLSNVRERLQKLYGDNAEFHISALGNRGVISSIQIPVEGLNDDITC